jgi:iron(II)-dependent oxidoreductase
MTMTPDTFQVLTGLCIGLVGITGLGCLAWRRHRRRRDRTAQPPDVADARVGSLQLDEPSEPQEASADVESLVDAMLAHGRYALLLRRQLVSNLSPAQFRSARELLQQQMSLVPEGEVMLAAVDQGNDEADRSTVWRVGGLFLDRYPVTNRQFHQFVAGGGYEQMAIWEPQIWPAVLDFVDTTGCPGPRFWKDGRYAAGEDDHPVVGVSWYEAVAYARWVGKRLPSEAEWVKTGSWPVANSGSRPTQRRFPWGDTMDRQRCNLWGSGPGRIVPVSEFSSGVSVGGVYQLIGNTWEWTTGNFGTGDLEGHELTLAVPMKSIRGGAFDTYFENQATCQFQSGENPLSRKHNIGFRCALGICDIASAPHAHREDELAENRDVPVDDPSNVEEPVSIGCSDDELVAVAEGANE